MGLIPIFKYMLDKNPHEMNISSGFLSN